MPKPTNIKYEMTATYGMLPPIDYDKIAEGVVFTCGCGRNDFKRISEIRSHMPFCETFTPQPKKSWWPF